MCIYIYTYRTFLTPYFGGNTWSLPIKTEVKWVLGVYMDIHNPEYLLINTPQLKKHHVRTPKFGLYLVLISNRY